MPSVDDVYNQLLAVNGKLDTLHNDLTTVTTAVNAVQSAVNQVNATLTNGFNQLVTLGTYTNQALYQNDQQNDTIICILEHISRNTCALLNQSVIQTALQTEMESDIDGIESMFATANPGAALERKRLQHLQEEIEKCCPPKKPEPPCTYRPCPAPQPIGPPPQLGGTQIP
jgi:DNA-binding FrmR family transcriptional regulator